MESKGARAGASPARTLLRLDAAPRTGYGRGLPPPWSFRLASHSNLQLGFSGRIEAVEARRAVGSLHLFLARIFEDAGGENLLAEITFIQLAVQNDFVDALQLAQRKLFRQQIEGDLRVLEL